MRVLVVLLAGQTLASMDGSILAVAAPSLRGELHASDAQLQLIAAAYTITFAALIVTGARLGDVVGRRRAFLAGLAAFTLTSLAGGLAPTPTVLVLARAGQGAAGALMTPQVLSIIQADFEGEARTRAIAAYSMVLAVGVAAGQVVGGLLVSVDLVTDAWRPALLVNAPLGAGLLLAARHVLPVVPPGPPRRLDLAGAVVMTVALVALVVPLSFGREAGWPGWVWPCLALSAAAVAGFAAVERRVHDRGGDPLFDLAVLGRPGVAAGVTTVVVVMAAYAGFLYALTLHLQDALGFTPLGAGLTFAAYASGFATASLTWPRAAAGLRARLPLLGAPAMAAGMAGVGAAVLGGGWPFVVTTPLLFIAGAGHALAFSPLANRLASSVPPTQAGDVSALVLTGSLVGTVVGVAGFTGIYLARAPSGSAEALAVTTAVLAAVLLLATAAAARALVPRATARRARAGSRSA